MIALDKKQMVKQVVAILSLKITDINLVVALEEKSGGVIEIHPLGTMNVWTKLHGNPQVLRYFCLDQCDKSSN